ncbi:MAG: type toxin-antitoxin system RelE/ParE family toxin [Mucilaginibacter sp.]|nr:type toxin-antitoxin system RelE/ParE family toxin [Mucilaginibacter sp.]
MAKRGSIRIEILPTAKTDLQDIVSFIAQGSLKYALLEKQLIINAINQLFSFPDLGKPFNYRSINARQLVFKNYLIIYRYKTETVLEILTIHHHARSIGNNPAFTDED